MLDVLDGIKADRCDAAHYAEAMVLRGQTLRKLERLEDAAAAFQGARKADPNGAWAEESQMALVDMAPYRKEAKSAKTSSSPKTPSAAREKPDGNSLADGRKSSPLATSPRETELHAAALLAVDSGNVVAAVQQVSDLLTEFPDSPLAGDALLYIGETTYANGDYVRAEKVFRKASEQHGAEETQQSAIYKLGWSQSRLAKHEEALATFTRLSSKFPQGRFAKDARFMRAESLYHLERFDDALLIFKELREDSELKPHVMGRVLFLGARCLQKTGAWSESIVWLKEMMKSNPQAAIQSQCQFMLGLAYDNTHDTEMALRHYRIASESDNKKLHLQATLQVARTLFGNNKLSDAIPYFELVVTEAYGIEGDRATQQLAYLSAVEAAECAHALAAQTDDIEQRLAWRDRAEQLRQIAEMNDADEKIRQAARDLDDRY